MQIRQIQNKKLASLVILMAYLVHSVRIMMNVKILTCKADRVQELAAVQIIVTVSMPKDSKPAMTTQ